jgi:hypothetical protein
VIYVYVCEDGHETEKKAGLSDVQARCSVCGKSAPRRPFNLVSIVGETVPIEQRQEVRDFQEASQEIDYHYTKAENDGMPVKRPDLWGKAKREARKRDPKVRA